MQHVTCLKAGEVVKIEASLVFPFVKVVHSAETIFMNFASNPASGLQASATRHANQETVKYIFAWQRCLFPAAKRLAKSTMQGSTATVELIRWSKSGDYGSCRNSLCLV